ncbi:MAG TPA: Gfo/Idh/MocA family oxidoreductase [Planctomycetota bacterium]|nr:Gfo/Idh/MocA family oxidoreductase [Planctomycetota bacterium]
MSSPVTTSRKTPIRFGIVGAGWRTEFFLRIARALPDRFEVLGVVVRNAEKAAAFAKQWPVKTFPSVTALLKSTQPRFVVSSVSWDGNPGVVRELVESGMPVLSETPPAPDVAGLRALWEFVEKNKGRVQVAEQVHLRPHHQAQMAVARSGKLGTVSHVQTSVAHGYHGISLLRRFLNVKAENATVRAIAFTHPVVQGAGRAGLPPAEKLVDSRQEFYLFDFIGRTALFDFAGEQYFHTIRNERLLVRGERGEIVTDQVHYLKDFRTPIRLDFLRHQVGADGDLHDPHLKGIQCGESWVYSNPFAPARLMDDEIAIAHALEKMDAVAGGGPDFYSLAEGSQDHYLYLVCRDALKSGNPIQTETQPWSERV